MMEFAVAEIINGPKGSNQFRCNIPEFNADWFV